MLTIPAGCPEWNYKKADHWDTKLLAKYNDINQQMPNLAQRITQFLSDTRPHHQSIFEELTVIGHACYAGQYRGSATCRCLRNYPIFIGPHEGSHPHHVEAHMRKFSQAASREIPKLQSQIEGIEGSRRLRIIAERGADFFVSFLTIHPYADGNGHIARLLILTWMYFFGYKINDFSWHPRPARLFYDKWIQQYRDGHTMPLIAMFITSTGPLNLQEEGVSD